MKNQILFSWNRSSSTFYPLVSELAALVKEKERSCFDNVLCNLVWKRFVVATQTARKTTKFIRRPLYSIYFQNIARSTIFFFVIPF